MAAQRTRGRRRLFIASLVTLLLVAAVTLPPLINISRYQRRIAASLSDGLGHPVEISGVKLRLLPRPAVQIANFTVESNSGYSAEPILQCSSVTASFRLLSLWRGQLEIASIALDEPSLNLERASDGQWNFASVLVQAARAPQAPTAQPASGQQTRFPYIEATHARINFKHGAEKLPFSFLDADVSVWLERPDEWQLRFAAQPMRTDINLSLADIGVLQVNGSVHRASTTHQLPLDLHVEWSKAPLGQVTRMLMKQDLGWRGDTTVTAHIRGVPDALRLEASATADDFHRETFEPSRPLNLYVTCTATYRHAAGSLDGIDCHSPVGSGRLGLTGAWQDLHTETPHPDLHLTVAQVPLAAALDLLRHTRRLSESLSVSGALDGEISYAIESGRNGTHSVARGSLQAANLLLRAEGVEQMLPDLDFTVAPGRPVALVLTAARLDLGSPQPLVADARLTRSGFDLHYRGSAQLERILPLAHAFHVLPGEFDGLGGQGGADYNVSVQGDWLLPFADDGQPAPTSTASGNLSIRNAVFTAPYLAEPLQVAAATATMDPSEIAWNAITGSIGDTRFSGSLHVPLACRASCARRFDIAAATLDLGSLAASLRGEDQGVVQELISQVRARSHDWPQLEGSIHAAHLLMGPVEVDNAAAALSLDKGTLSLSRLDGRTLGGAIHATATATLGSKPVYATEIELTHAAVPELSQLFKERWGPGLIDLTAKLAMAGTTAADLGGSARGTIEWDWAGGSLPQLTTSPLHRFDRWSGEGRIARNTLTIGDSEITSGAQQVPVRGTMDLDRSLHLKLGSAASDEAAAVSGSLAAPTVAAP